MEEIIPRMEGNNTEFHVLTQYCDSVNIITFLISLLLRSEKIFSYKLVIVIIIHRYGHQT